MKRLLLIMFFVFFIPFICFADEVDKGLPSDTSSRIKESARQVAQVGIESKAVIKMTQRMIANSFTEEQIIAGHELLIKAKRQNLDEEPIINTVHEGIAKKVGADNILQAMEKVRARYVLANTYTQEMKLEGDDAKALAEEIADCMKAGMDKSSLNNLVGMLEQKTGDTNKGDAFKLSENTFKTARDMARSGAGSKDIVDVMNNALNRNYNAGQMEKLGNTFMAQSKGSSSPSELAKAYSNAIENGATPDNIGNFAYGTPPQSGRMGPGASPSSGGMAAGGPPPSGGMGSGASPPSGGMGSGTAPPSGDSGSGGAPPGGGSNIGRAGTGGEPGGPATPPSGGPGMGPGGEKK